MVEREKSKVEKGAEKWFKENGFDYKIIKQYISKTIYQVSKDGVTDKCEVLAAVTNISSYMESYGRSFELGKQIAELQLLEEYKAR